MTTKTQKFPILRHTFNKSGDFHETILNELPLSLAQLVPLLELGSIYLNEKRVHSNIPLIKTGDHIRIHLEPRRFNVNLIRYPDCMIDANLDFIVINKPSGVPVPPTVDNAKENLLQHLSDLRGEKLHVTHRLDIATSGLILIARTKDAQKKINQLLSERKINKIYRAKVRGRFSETGLIVHYMEPSPRAPKVVSREAQANWLKCELVVRKIDYNSEQNISEIEIELLTGRTHQIRAQLAKMGFPVIGDFAYGSTDVVSHKHESILLQSSQLSFAWGDTLCNYSI